MVASLRVVTIGEGLEMVSLTQPLAWDLVLNNKIRERVAELAGRTMLGTVARGREAPSGPAAREVPQVEAERRRHAALQLSRGGLTEDALRTLILLVLTTGADVRRSLTG